MREIIFRAKELRTNDWIYGYPLRFGFTGKEKWFLLPTFASSFYEREIDQSTIGEWTFLRDIKGVRIFEGDILEIRYKDQTYRRAVRWYGGKGEPVFDFDDSSDVCDCNGLSWLMNSSANYLVIGNIYDNPELLKGGEA